MPASKRLRSLDALRGLTVAGMIVVNCPGGDEGYAWAKHAPWHGFTPADLVFPAFLVIMGAAAALAHDARRRRGESERAVLGHVALRAAGLLVLGLLSNAFTGGDGALRWPGVLQRIAVCYLGVHALLAASPRAAGPLSAALLLGYWALLALVPAPGRALGVLTPEANVASWLDRRLLGPHNFEPWGDAEGLLSTLPALATALVGAAAGRRLIERGAAEAGSLARGGLALAALGWAWSFALPLNKSIWTSSFAALTGGLTLLGLAACLRAAEDRPAPWARPFEAVGRHALAAYVLSGLVYGVLEYADLKAPLAAALFGSWLEPRAASLAFALAFAAAFTAAASLVAQRLDRR